MGKLRFLFALWMAKLSVPALKITRHEGTDFPGSLACKLCPDFFFFICRPASIVAVTGTDGKTTVSNTIADILEANGRKVLSNRERAADFRKGHPDAVEAAVEHDAVDEAILLTSGDEQMFLARNWLPVRAEAKAVRRHA